MDNRVSCLSNTCASAHVRHSNGKLRAQVKLLNLSTTQTDETDGTDGTEKQKQRKKNNSAHRVSRDVQTCNGNKGHGTQYYTGRKTVHRPDMQTNHTAHSINHDEQQYT